jgi:hypothetical protein
MYKKVNVSPLFVIVILVFLAFLMVQGSRSVSGLHGSSFDSPILTPWALDPKFG